MGHKLQISKLSNTDHVVIEDENGVIVATTVGDIDHEKFANEIITAVNVMPEMVDFLIDLLNQDLNDSMTKKNINLLEKLSGHKLCPDCGAELITKDTYGMGGDECWDWCPECERMVP